MVPHRVEAVLGEPVQRQEHDWSISSSSLILSDPSLPERPHALAVPLGLQGLEAPGHSLGHGPRRLEVRTVLVEHDSLFVQLSACEREELPAERTVDVFAFDVDAKAVLLHRFAFSVLPFLHHFFAQ